MRVLKQALWLSAFWLSEGLAQQVIEARDGVSVEAIMSRREPTRIRIEGTAITDVFGSVYSSNCNPPATESTLPGMAPDKELAINPSGEIVLECDRSKGEIYIKPVGADDKPVNLFIASSQATYTLVLRQADTPANTIVIRDTSLRASATKDRAAAPLRAMKHLLSTMVAERSAPEYQTEELQRELTLWSGTRFVLTRRYEGSSLVGERYELRNLGDREMVLAEQEFDQRAGDVAGIAIEQHTLRPGESSAVFVIRRAKVQP